MNLAVDIAGHLELLGRLKRRLAEFGVRAEVRDHLMSLVVFPPAPALPICVFVGGDGQSFSWDRGHKRTSVADLTRAADELASIATCHWYPHLLSVRRGGNDERG